MFTNDDTQTAYDTPNVAPHTVAAAAVGAGNDKAVAVDVADNGAAGEVWSPTFVTLAAAAGIKQEQGNGQTTTTRD